MPDAVTPEALRQAADLLLAAADQLREVTWERDQLRRERDRLRREREPSTPTPFDEAMSRLATTLTDRIIAAVQTPDPDEPT